MGWTYTYKPKGEPVLDFFIRQGVLRWGDDKPWECKVLDSALVRMRTFYAAVEQVHRETGERRVWAAVILCNHVPKDLNYNFGYKDMDESVGPCEAECPERILKLLTETEYEYAKDWRQRCWDRIARKKSRPKIVKGTVLRYGGSEYVVDKPLGNRGYSVHEVVSGYPYRMNKVQASRSEILTGISHV